MGRTTHIAAVPVTADVLRRRVMEALSFSTRLEGALIEVDVDGSIAILRGNVLTPGMAALAVELTQGVPGITAVVDELDVGIAAEHGDDDVALLDRALLALASEPRVPRHGLHVSAADGVLQLGGRVEDAAAHEAATRCVLGLPGLRGLVNSLVVAPAGAPSAAQLQRVVEAALDRHAEHVARHVHAELVEGAARVTGHVRSRAEHDAVIGAVRGCPGVHRVDDHLEID